MFYLGCSTIPDATLSGNVQGMLGQCNWANLIDTQMVLAFPARVVFDTRW